MIERFWDAYFRSLKPLEVEEPIDVWVHRPPAYVLARLLLPTPVSPNAVTVGSILLGVCAGVAIFLSRAPWHLPAAGALIFSSAVFDCADGQLARLRKSSSAFGRMLDGAADLVVSSVVVLGGAWLIVMKFTDPWWLCVIVAALALLTIVTGSFHTTMYDQYKNLFLRLTHPSFREGEDLAAVEARYQEQKDRVSFVIRCAWWVYLAHNRGQDGYVRTFDPNAQRLWAITADFSERNAAIYRKHAAGVMRVWRNFFGFGSLVFGLAVSIGLDVCEYYLLFRLVLLNAVFYGYLRPAQRRATQLALEEITSPA